MKNVFRIVSKVLFVVCLGSLFSLLNAKEAACYNDGNSGADLRLTIDFDSVAFGQSISTNLPITISFPENNFSPNNIECSITSWIKDGALASGNFTAGTYDYYIRILAHNRAGENPDTVPNVYVNGSQLTNVTLDSSSSLSATYYASGSVTIAAPTYTITFEPNGGNFNGSTTAATRTTGTDGKLTAFPEVQYDGHTLVGWFDNATSTTTRVELDKVYTGATTLTAHWTETPSYHTVTYHVVNGKWNDDTTGDKSERTEDNGFLHNIPAVGNKPNANYRAGSWSPSVPDTETRITGNRTYTYTYAQNSPTYNVTVTTDGHGEAFANKRSGVSGTRVTLREVPDDGYRFKQWEVISGGVVLDNYRDYTTSFTIGSADVVIKAHFEKKEEHTRENDYGPEESKSEAAWTPEKAAATIAAEKAAKQQAAGTQIVAVQTMLRTFATTKPGGPGEAPTVINLDMTKVDILDRGTVNLLVLNNKFEYNIKISVVGGLTTTVKIPANFNFRPFIKADGTMNIHEVLWSIVQKTATRKGSIYMIRRE